MADIVSNRTVWPNYSAANVQSAATRQPTDTLGKDQFLSILVTQLRNQDPMQPLQDREFIAQMAQFTSVEQLMNMNKEMALLRQNIGSASSMIGKTIEWYEYNEAGEIILSSGVVDAIVSKEGILYAKSGRSEVALDYISSISEAGAGAGQPESESKETADGSGEEGDSA